MAKESKQERKIERQLITIGIFFVVIIAIYFGASVYFRSLNQITYDGLVFSKERVTTNLTVFHHQYYFKSPTGKLLQYNLYLRNNPYELASRIPLGGENVSLNPKQPVYFTINNTGLVDCRLSSLAVGTLASYLADNQFKVIRGDMNFWTANAANGEAWTTCEQKPNSKVIELYRGEKTQVELSGNCYRIMVETCDDVLAVVERFILESVVDARRVTVDSSSAKK